MMLQKRFIGVVPYVLFILLGGVFFPSAGRDDVHFTFWAANALSSFGEITNYNGERIEQSSSLLHTVILAAIKYITDFNIVDIGVFLSIFFGLVTIYLTGKVSRFLNQKKIFPQVITATSVPLLYWSFGALEASLVSATILFLLIATMKFTSNISLSNYVLTVVAISLYLLVRPEAVFVLSLFLIIPLVIFFYRHEKFSPFLVLFITTNILFIIILLFRYLYFGAFFPQPVEAKIGWAIIQKINSGGYYFLTSLGQYPFFIVLALPVVIYMTIKVKETIKNKDLLIVISFLFTYALFVFSAGGDWMEGARFFVPVIGPSATIAALIYIPLIGQNRAIRFGVISNLAVLLYFTLKFSTGYPIIYYKDYLAAIPNAKEFSFFETANRVHYRDIPLIIELKAILEVMTSKGIQPNIMSMQGGMVPYHVFQTYYGVAKFVDLSGLSTRDFTECKITENLPKFWGGISVGYEYFVSHALELQDACGIDVNIIYDLDSKSLERLNIIEASGYTVVYLQTGEIGSNDVLSKGSTVDGTQFIALKQSLASQLGLEKKVFSFK